MSKLSIETERISGTDKQKENPYLSNMEMGGATFAQDEAEEDSNQEIETRSVFDNGNMPFGYDIPE